ncbi:type II CAAX prenyl endopeptidase Rce1 family protein [Crenothrix polyspora]|uniref:Abortive infection protein n=1 Tax=Crenothrix polyspora TaxID=360316 RepID=A0A1R4HGK5_9GAMM|nr:CPBP family glutamic-type intramembrane protease [Crenothrix polyspora]SJM95347.1 Abortive infection protein [Crenothrix polyspora]
MKRYLYALVPLLVLLLAISLACIVGYCVIHGMNSDIALRKIIRKSTQGFLLLSIIPAMFYLKLNKQALGIAARPIFIKQLLQGFGLGFLTLLPVFIVLYALGINVIDSTQPWTWDWVAKKLLIELLLALLVSCFEEPIFRGIVLAGLSKKIPVTPAVFIAAFYYAILHFLDSKTPIPKQALDIFSGFHLLGEAFINVLNPDILSAFSSLLLVGIFLGLLRTRVQASLGLCIGCHTCWVWQIKMTKTLFNTNWHADFAYLVSSYDGVIGPLVTVWLASAIVVYLFYQKIQQKISRPFT